ncbi:MAG: hypothetical protein ACRC6M_00190 [Microcystaceae cyanobacterium]
MARKSKEFRELFQQKNVKPSKFSQVQVPAERENKALKDFKSTLESKPEHEGKLFINAPKGLGKISEKLMEFVLPYLEATNSVEERKSLFSLAVMAWNLALLTKEEREEVLGDDLFGLANPLDREALQTVANHKDFLEELMERKLKLFAYEKRSIEDFQLAEEEDELRVMVTSSLT